MQVEITNPEIDNADSQPEYRVNGKGLAAIKAWVNSNLNEDHQDGYIQGRNGQLDAWALEAEESMEHSGQAIIELPSWATISGHTETFTVPSDGIDLD